MPEKKVYRVEALEKFIHRTTYYVEAESPKEAVKLCKAGKVAYEDSEVEEGDEVWLKTVEVEEDKGKTAPGFRRD